MPGIVKYARLCACGSIPVSADRRLKRGPIRVEQGFNVKAQALKRRSRVFCVIERIGQTCRVLIFRNADHQGDPVLVCSCLTQQRGQNQDCNRNDPKHLQYPSIFRQACPVSRGATRSPAIGSIGSNLVHSVPDVAAACPSSARRLRLGATRMTCSGAWRAPC